jgi:hypothetical protein
MGRELGQSFFDDFISLKKFQERMGNVIEIINIQQNQTGRYICFYWCVKNGALKTDGKEE